MSSIQFSSKDIKLAKKYPKVKFDESKIKSKRKHQVFKCSIDGYNLRIGRYKVSKTWAIKFAKWILKSFDK